MAAIAPLIVVVGPTASGKSELAMELATQFNGEIICADSWTVRREVNIGTAKPSPEERQKIPHHLLDVVGPAEEFTAAVFKRLALQAIDDVARVGKLPIMVGGTGLYIDGVLYDFSFLPEGNRLARAKWNAMTLDGLLDEIQARGLSTEGIDVRNKRRLIRLLETDGQRPLAGPLRPNTLIVGIKVLPEILKQRIRTRVDAMLADGLEGEVASLVKTYGWECEALKGIGYREWHGYFDGSQSLAETKEKIIKSTQDLAKRQNTWFKRNSSIQWVKNKIQAVDIATTFLNKKP